VNRLDAWLLLTKYVKNKNLRKHCLACEAALEDLAPEFGEEPETWGLAGLLHDLDVELTKQNPEKHAIVAVEILGQEGFDKDFTNAILAHCNKAERKSNLDRALYAVDPTTGLIVASALMHPEKSLKAVDLIFLKKRFKEKRFAAGADRRQISSCIDLGFGLDEFLSRTLASMQRISGDLEL